MTAPSTAPASMARTAKRKDTSNKGARPKVGVDLGQITVARATGINTSTYEGAESIDPNKPLTEKQKLFVRFWAEGDSIPGAARRAGYADSASLAYRMVRMPNVLKLKAEYEAEYEAVSEMSRKKVMDGLLESIEMAKLMAEPSTMIQGWKTVAQMCGYMAPVETKLKIDVTGNVTMSRLTQMSDAELLELIEKGNQNASTPALSHSAPLGAGS